MGSLQFIRKQSYDLWAAVGLLLGGPLAVLIAAFIVKSLPLDFVRWGVVAVVILHGDRDAENGRTGARREDRDGSCRLLSAATNPKSSPLPRRGAEIVGGAVGDGRGSTGLEPQLKML